MMNAYRRVPIGEVADIRRGASPRPIDDWMSPSGISWVKISDATKTDSRFIYETEGFIREDGKSKSVEVFPEDLIISNSATPGLPRIMKIHACIHDGWLLVENFHGITRDYLFYQIKYMRKYLVNQGNGSIFTNLKTDILKEFPISIPVDNNGEFDIQKQNEIVSVLQSIEDKIENNTAICADLEAMAKLIYDYWFVQFDFPDENGKPYKSSGGKMVWNEDLKREIPAGWKAGHFRDVLSSLECGDRPSGGADTSRIPSIGAENIIGIGRYDYSSEKYIPKQYFNNMRSGVVQSWDVLMYKDGAGVGQVSMFGDSFPYEKCAVNSHVFILRSEDNLYQDYLYLTLCKEYVKKLIIALAMKAAQPGLNQTAVKSIPLLLPKKDILSVFNQRVNVLFHKVFISANESAQLAALRDFLLPMLMNGQVKVA